MLRAVYNALAALGSRTMANAPVSIAVGQGLLTVHAGAMSIIPVAVDRVKPEMSTSQVFPPRLASAACSTLQTFPVSLLIQEMLPEEGGRAKKGGQAGAEDSRILLHC